MPLYLLPFLLTVFFLTSTGHSQVEQEKNNYPDIIKSIVFKAQDKQDQFPIIQLGETITLNFDDITAQENDYYYTITHCNYDWTVSNLSKNQYLQGQDYLRIINYNNSFNTLQAYTNYHLTIPNANTSLLLSGNYILKVFDDYDTLVFSRKFLVYENTANVKAKIQRPRTIENLHKKHNLEFEVSNNNATSFINPRKLIKTVLLQNYNWQTAIYHTKAQYFRGNTLLYRYDNETAFLADNEYYNFDSKDLLGANVAIEKVIQKEVYHHYLYANTPRENIPYTYYPDINGDFVIRTLRGTNPNTEAEYIQVHFTLDIPLEKTLNKDYYVVGKFNNYNINNLYKLQYNTQTKKLQTKVLLKQGFYNYKFIATPKGKTTPKTALDDNHFATENQYTILVYYRGFGDRHDSLIGVGSTNSGHILE